MVFIRQFPEINTKIMEQVSYTKQMAEQLDATPEVISGRIKFLENWLQANEQHMYNARLLKKEYHNRYQSLVVEIDNRNDGEAKAKKELDLLRARV